MKEKYYRSPRGLVAKMPHSDIEMNEFELQSPYYKHFRTNTLEKGMNPIYPPSYGLNSNTTVLLKG